MRFTTSLLHTLVQEDPEFHFYVLVPAKHEEIWAAALSHPRITPLAIEIERRLHGGDFQFCPVRLYDSFDFRRFDVDLLFLNQPETAPALLNFFNRQTFHNVPAVAYVHWFDTRRPSTPKETLHRPALLGALSGMMVCAAVGCNSAYGRAQILEQAAHWFHKDAITSLNQRMRLLPPGIDVREIARGRVDQPDRRRHRILVNHRVLKYTGVRTLLTSTFPKLWQRRRDFSVLVTNPSRVRLPGTMTRAPWLTINTLDRPEYIRQLWESDIVVGPHRACHWSISALEAICAECVPLMTRESFYPEMMTPLLHGLSVAERKHIATRWFYYRGSLINRLSQVLDNLDAERLVTRRIAVAARATYDWGTLAQSWRQVFREAERGIPMMAEKNPSMRRIIELMRVEKRVSKIEILRHLRWAPKQRALSWTAFRKRLKAIAFEDASSPEAVFELCTDGEKPSETVSM